MKPRNCDKKADNIYLFFEGEYLDFQYRKIGLIEAKGDRYAGSTELLNFLKYEAWKNCANGIIHISDNYVSREEGMLFSESSREEYTAKTYNGIAVEITMDSAFLAKYGNEVDTAFVGYIREELADQEKEYKSDVTISVVGVLIGIIVAVVAVVAGA
ncbi:hypothetical protein AAG747_22075 [Rapidithrix thailandica]|uniref:Uncharacterized protein n=1 Tax=Rapidithrix thailandica TaxID=413964 RepID=A0AAW9SH85_9BACT